MAVVYREEKHYYSSVLFRFICKDVYFSKLKYYPSTQGPQKEKKNLSEYISDTAICVKKHNRKNQGLSLPLNVMQDFENIKMENYTKWVLGYHKPQKYNFLYLFPYTPKLKRTSNYEVDISDLKKNKLPDNCIEIPDFDFKANEIYIWPELIFTKPDYKSTGGYVFEVPEFFLKPSIYEVKEFQFQAQVIEEEEKEMIEPDRLFFNLFYDVHGNLIYFKNRFVKQLKTIIPDFLFSPEGCVWAKDKELMKISTFKDRFCPDKWVSG